MTKKLEIAYTSVSFLFPDEHHPSSFFFKSRKGENKCLHHERTAQPPLGLVITPGRTPEVTQTLLDD